jgi:hypothetical protein
MFEYNEEITIEWSLRYQKLHQIFDAGKAEYPYLAEITENAVDRKTKEDKLVFQMLYQQITHTVKQVSKNDLAWATRMSSPLWSNETISFAILSTASLLNYETMGRIPDKWETYKTKAPRNVGHRLTYAWTTDRAN